MTQLSLKDLRSAAEDTLSSSTQYIYDAVLGGLDHSDLFSQLSEASFFHLLFNPSAVYDLLLQGTVALSPTIDRIALALQDVSSAVTALVPQQRLPLRSSAAERAASNLSNVLRYGKSERDIQIAMRALSSAVLAIPGIDEVLLEEKIDVAETWSGVVEDLASVASTLQSLRSGVSSFKALLVETSQKERVQQNQLLLADEVLSFLESGHLSEAKNHFLRLASISSLFNTISASSSFFSGAADPPVVTVVPQEDGTTVSVSSSAGPYALSYEDAVSLNGVTAALNLSERPWFSFASDPTPSIDPRHLYAVLGYQDQWGTQPFRVEIQSLGWAHGRLQVLADFSTALVGRLCALRYVGDRSLLTPAVRTAVESNEQRYMVVFARGTNLPNPEIELEPPIPDTTTVPLTGWELVLDAHTVRWDYPSAFTKTQFVTQLSGPDSNSSVDVLQPWRVHHRMTGVASGPLRPGERVYVGLKDAVVIYHDIVSGHLYTHTPFGTFLPAEVLTGRNSLETFTVTTVDGVVGADIPSLAGQANAARAWTAHPLSNGLYVQARDVIGEGGSCTLSGTSLTLSLAAGERGFDELGVFSGDSIDLGGTVFVLDTIPTNTSAIVLGGGGVYTGGWRIPPPKRTDVIQLYTRGLNTQLTTDTSGNRVLRSDLLRTPTPEVVAFSGTTRRVIPASEVVAKLKTIFSGVSVTVLGADTFSISSASDLVFGAGSAHAVLGLPVSQTRVRTTKKVRMRQGATTVTLSDVQGSAGDFLDVGGVSYRIERDEAGVLTIDPAIPRQSSPVATLRNGRQGVWEASASFIDTMLEQFAKVEEAARDISFALESFLYAESELRGRIARELGQLFAVISSWLSVYQLLRAGIPSILSTTSTFLQMFDEEGLQGVNTRLLSGDFVSALQDTQFHQATSPGELLDLLSEVSSHLGVRVDPSILEDEEGVTVDVDLAYDEDAYDVEDAYPEDADP